jgi:hypothetical protein
MASNFNHEPEDLLVVPPDKVFIVTGDGMHVTWQGSSIGSDIVAFCGKQVVVVSKTNQAYESEVCPACLLA